jgi:hypothetical protein
MRDDKMRRPPFSGLKRTYAENLASADTDVIYPVAALLCAIAFFLRLILSGPVLNMIGINYGGDDASSLAKIHPASYVVFAAFLTLIFSRGNPVANLVHIARHQTAYFVFFSIYLLIIVYWIFRGPKGMGQILDVHIVAPLTAILFCYAPRSWCRTIVYLFVGFAVLNSLVGIGEAATHMRLFAFDSDWEVLRQDYFRASAFEGHPLANAVFTVVALFVILSLRMPAYLKAMIFLVMLASLVAFGGRSALVFCVIGLVILGLIEAKKHLSFHRLSVLQLVVGVGATLIMPLICLGLLYTVLHSSVGERLMAYNSLSDESADVRMLTFHVFDYMSVPDLIFGSDGDHILDIATQAGLKNPSTDIENPWILMFMFLGGIMFTLWLFGLVGYIAALMKGASPAVKIAVIEYFAIASTSNSFGRKDLIYMIVAGIVVGVKRMHEPDERPPQHLSS